MQRNHHAQSQRVININANIKKQDTSRKSQCYIFYQGNPLVKQTKYVSRNTEKFLQASINAKRISPSQIKIEKSISQSKKKHLPSQNKQRIRKILSNKSQLQQEKKQAGTQNNIYSLVRDIRQVVKDMKSLCIGIKHIFEVQIQLWKSKFSNIEKLLKKSVFIQQKIESKLILIEHNNNRNNEENNQTEYSKIIDFASIKKQISQVGHTRSKTQEIEKLIQSQNPIRFQSLKQQSYYTIYESQKQKKHEQSFKVQSNCYQSLQQVVKNKQSSQRGLMRAKSQSRILKRQKSRQNFQKLKLQLNEVQQTLSKLQNLIS